MYISRERDVYTYMHIIYNYICIDMCIYIEREMYTKEMVNIYIYIYICNYREKTTLPKASPCVAEFSYVAIRYPRPAWGT